MPRRLAQQGMTLSDLECPSRAISAVAELLVITCSSGSGWDDRSVRCSDRWSGGESSGAECSVRDLIDKVQWCSVR